MYCGNCGFDMKDRAFCPQCGAPAPSGSSPQGEPQNSGGQPGAVGGGMPPQNNIPGGYPPYGQPYAPGQAPMPQKPPKSKKTSLIVLCVIGGVILLAVIGNLANGSKGKTSSASSSASSASSSVPSAASSKASSSKAESQPKQAYALGETGELDGVQVTVTDVKKSSGSTYDKPKSGKEFVIVTIKIVNSSKKTIDYNPLDFQVQNSQGQIDSYTFTTVDNDTALSYGDLAAGGTVTGTIAYEEPKDDAGLIMIYKPNMFIDKTMQFKLS